MRKHIFYNTVNFQPVTFRILFFRGIQTLQMRLSWKACFWWTQLLRPFCRAADELCCKYSNYCKRPQGQRLQALKLKSITSHQYCRIYSSGNKLKINKYTERQTKHCFFRATLTEIQSIKMNHNWSRISNSTPYQAHLQKKKILRVKKE